MTRSAINLPCLGRTLNADCSAGSISHLVAGRSITSGFPRRMMRMKHVRTFAHLAASSTSATFRSGWQPLPLLQCSGLEAFKDEALKPARPVLIPKAFHLPAARTWLLPGDTPMLNHSYLAPFADTTLVPLELTRGPHGQADSFQRVPLAPLSLFLAYAALPAQERSERRFYIAQAPLSALPHTLQADFPTPHLVREAGSGDVYGTSLWMGMGGSCTPLHRDPNPNLLVQLAGKKRVRLVEDSVGRGILERVRRSSGTGIARGNNVRGDEMMKEERTQLEWEMWENEDAKGWEGTVDANDGVFIPTGWWHAIRGEHEGLNVSVRTFR